MKKYNVTRDLISTFVVHRVHRKTEAAVVRNVTARMNSEVESIVVGAIPREPVSEAVDDSIRRACLRASGRR